MQIHANLASDSVLGTASDPISGGSTLVNGKYTLPVPEGVSVPVTASSYVLPKDSGSLQTLIANDLLARNPGYQHQTSNFFAASADIALLDLGAAPFPAAGNISTGAVPVGVPASVARCQVGRGAGPAPVGIAPNSVAMLPINPNAASTTYGCIITDTLDITSFNPGNPGTDEVMVWWKVAQMSTTEDIVTGYNITGSLNTPARKTLDETSQTPPGLLVYASVDDGVTWRQVQHLQPTDLVTPGMDLRLAFVNDSAAKIHLLGYVVMFPDLP